MYNISHIYEGMSHTTSGLSVDCIYVAEELKYEVVYSRTLSVGLQHTWLQYVFGKGKQLASSY